MNFSISRFDNERLFDELFITLSHMLIEGFKLMILGMTTVMLFLMLMILFIECVKYFNLNFTALEKTSLEKKEKNEFQNANSSSKIDLPIEVFAAAIKAFESDRKKEV